MRAIVISSLLILFLSNILWANHQVYSKVQIHFQKADEIAVLAVQGLLFDHAHREKNPAPDIMFAMLAQDGIAVYLISNIRFI